MASFLLAIIYISFISLGLPDALLGGAWPTMHMEFGVPVSYAGIISMIICMGKFLTQCWLFLHKTVHFFECDNNSV